MKMNYTVWHMNTHFCYKVWDLGSNFGTQSPWNSVLTELSHHGTQSPWNSVTTELSPHGTQSPWNSVPMKLSHHGTQSLWNIVTIELVASLESSKHHSQKFTLNIYFKKVENVNCLSCKIKTCSNGKIKHY